MPYTTREAITTLSTYLGINLGVSVRSIDQTSNRGYEIRLPSGDRCVIFVYPISHKQDDSKNFFDTRDSGARERGIAWNYAQTRNLKYFCLAVHDQVEKYKDYIFSLECDEHRITEVSGTLNGSRNGRGTQVVIPTSCVPSKNFERIHTDNGFYIAVVHKNHLYDYLEQYDNRPYMDKTLPLVDTAEIEESGCATNVSPDVIKAEFELFLKNVAKNKKGGPLAPGTIGNCLSNLQKNMKFLKEFESKNIYEISSIDTILFLQEELSKNEEYMSEDRDKTKGNGYYRHSLEQYKKFLIYYKEKTIELVEIDEESTFVQSPFTPVQVIYYGVPGCGKSHAVDKIINEAIAEFNKDKNAENQITYEKQVIRTVFHPDYCYADFVGQIMPQKERDGGIKYEFKPGPLANIIRKAYLNPSKPYFLIIEEINRGNAAAIFGESFQLLDRYKKGEHSSNEEIQNENYNYTEGWSKYSINNDDVNDFILQGGDPKVTEKEPGVVYESDSVDSPKSAIKIPSRNMHFSTYCGIRLPPNLSLYATMNTSDQNVFTLDNAFQRRWEMKQVTNKLKDNVPQNLSDAEKDAAQIEVNQYNEYIGGTIENGGTSVKWGEFREEINKIIMLSAEENGLLSMEDKRLGGWFITPKNEPDDPEGTPPKITKKAFAEKVLKYLWDDAFKFDRTSHFGSTTTLEDLIEDFEDNGFKVFVGKADKIAKLQPVTTTGHTPGEGNHTDPTIPTPDPNVPATV